MQKVCESPLIDRARASLPSVQDRICEWLVAADLAGGSQNIMVPFLDRGECRASVYRGFDSWHGPARAWCSPRAGGVCQ